MYKLLALFNGLLICIMILLNSTLAQATGLYYALLIINSISLFIIIIIIFFKKIPLKGIFSLPKYFYLVGIIGLVNTTLNSVCFINLGATLTIGLLLYGQLITSLIIDFGGFLGMEKQNFNPKKLIGIFIMSIGILVMILY